MPRKKISTVANPAAVIDLDDDEEFVESVTTTKRVGRQRKPKPDDAEAAPPDDDENIIDIDDDGEPVERYGDNSLAAVLYGDSDDADAENQFCSIHIRRHPDNLSDKFATPCTEVTNLQRIANVPLSTDRADIEERVVKEYGGGHYFFQIHFDGRLGRSWRSTLADLPAAKRIQPDAPAASVPTPAAPAVDPVRAFLDNLKKQKEMQELLFGEQEKELKAQIAELKTQIERGQATPSQPQSEQLLILEKALSATSPELQDRLLEYAFPSDDAGKRHWIAELADVALANKDTILGLFGSLFGGIAPPQPTPAPPPAPMSLDELLRQPAPAGELAEQPTGFRRRETSPLRAEFDAALDAGPPTDDDAEAPDVPVQAFIDQPPDVPLYETGTAADEERIDEGNGPDEQEPPTNAKGRRKAA